MSRSPSPSKLAAARIPKITDLRELLDYGDGRLARCSTFNDDLRIYRRRYSLANLRGTDLWNWRLSSHQDALRRMTASFLDEDGYGEVYWPSDPTAANFNSLQYSTDRTFIARTVRQLIFQLNLQQYRNEKYKKKAHQPVHEIIDLEDDGPDTRLKHSESSIESSATSPATTATIQAYAGAFDASARVPLTAPDPLQQERDIYDIPTSPDYTPEPSTTKRKLNAPSRNNPQKRSKIVSLKIGPGKLSNTHHRPIAPMPMRTSPRVRKTLPRVNYADVIDLDQPFTSPISATESTIVRDSGAGHQNQANVRPQFEDDEVVFNYMRTSQPLVTNESIPPTPTDVPEGATGNSNIDPDLERTSSIAFSVNPPTHHALQQSGPSLPSPSLAHEGPSINVQPEAEEALSPTRTMSIVEPMHATIEPVHAAIARMHAATAPMHATIEPMHAAIEPMHATIEPMHGMNKISASLLPSPVPSDAKNTAEQVTKSSPATISRPAAASSTDSKAGINFHYKVILSRTPVYQVRSWQPKGHFLEKSLSELIDELPFENKEGVIGLIIRLTGPGVDIEETIECGQDAVDDYNSVKEDLMQIVKMCLKGHIKASTGSKLVMKFMIEAVREGGVDKDKNESDDDDHVLLF